MARSTLVKGRMSAALPEEGVVVFLIGSQIHAWWAIHRWLPVALAFTAMMRELRSGKVPGFLGARPGPGATVQYWSSRAALLAYAHDQSGRHFPAWAAFNKRIRRSGVVGIWHEIFEAPAAGVSSLYMDTTPAGLGAAFPLVPATHGRPPRAPGRGIFETA